MLPPEHRAYALRAKHALRCGVPGCSCAEGLKVHCPSHDNAEVPTLTIGYEPGYGFSFECTRCPRPRVLDALAKRGLTPESHLFTSSGAQEVGLQPFNFLIQQPQDWLWPNRIPLGKLTLIAGYPSSGKTSIALDIAARVSRGAAAPDQPDVLFPSAPVVLAPLNGNPRADILPTLRLFGADLDRVYLADLLSSTHPIDYYPDEPPAEDPDEPPDADEDDWDDEERPARRRKSGFGFPLSFSNFEEPAVVVPKLTAPWPGLSHVMGRLANLVEARKRRPPHRRPGGGPRLDAPRSTRHYPGHAQGLGRAFRCGRHCPYPQPCAQLPPRRHRHAAPPCPGVCRIHHRRRGARRTPLPSPSPPRHERRRPRHTLRPSFPVAPAEAGASHPTSPSGRGGMRAARRVRACLIRVASPLLGANPSSPPI